MVVAFNTGDVKLELVVSKLPFSAASYQAYVPPGEIGVKVAVEPAQILIPGTAGGSGI